jgi:hypothetical protein
LLSCDGDGPAMTRLIGRSAKSFPNRALVKIRRSPSC